MILLLRRGGDGAVLFEVGPRPAIRSSGFEMAFVRLYGFGCLFEIFRVEVAEGQVDIGVIRVHEQGLSHGLLSFRKLTAALKDEP